MAGHSAITGKETVPESGSPALSMTAAPLWLRRKEKPLENADRGAGWRLLIIESAGESLFGTLSSGINGTRRRLAQQFQTRGLSCAGRRSRGETGPHAWEYGDTRGRGRQGLTRVR